MPALPYLLRDCGHAVTVDGVFGPRTMAAVLGFRRALGVAAELPAGAVGWRHWSAAYFALAAERHLVRVSLGRGAPSARGQRDDCAVLV